MDNLDSIAESIRAELEAKNTARDEALRQSRILIRSCASAIKSVHRQEWARADAGLVQVREEAATLAAQVRPYPDLYHSGYVQDALKEVAEAFVINALVQGQPLPTPEALGVEPATYLNGLGEAASELRRTILDLMRQHRVEQAETLLERMDTIYATLMTFDYADAISGGLRRRVDSLRGVLERTRGDLTTSLRQQQLIDALKRVEKGLSLEERGEQT